MKTRVILVDDHALVRAGIRSLLEKLPWIEVAAEASNGREALELVRRHSPNVVLMDVAMSELNGLEAAGRLAREFPATRVIILSMHANEEYVVQAIRTGAAGYLLKDAAITELEEAIRAVTQGRMYLGSALSRRVIEDYLQRISQTGSPLDQLTPRQREILQLIAEGKSTKEIAATLQVSVKTVETHRAQLMDRLGIYDVPGLVRYAMKVGLIAAPT